MMERQRIGEGLRADRPSVAVVQPTAPSSLSWLSADLQENLQTILDQLSRLVDCDACALLLLTNDTLYIAASQGLSDPATTGQLSSIFNEQQHLSVLLREGRPVVMDSDLVELPLKVFLGSVDMHSAILAPLVYRSRPVGLLMMLKKEPNFYSEKDAQSTLALANQAAMTIENARLYAETRRQALLLEAVSQVSQKVISILELDQLLVEVVRLIRERLGHYHVHLFLVDGSSNEIVLRESS